MKIIVDMSKGMRIICTANEVLTGECLRCGLCCNLGNGCEELAVEEVDGKQRYFCKVYFDRPMRCALYPMPDDTLVETCGLKWTKGE